MKEAPRWGPEGWKPEGWGYKISRFFFPSLAPISFFFSLSGGIFSFSPELHIAFCPLFFVHPLFPVFEPHVQQWMRLELRVLSPFLSLSGCLLVEFWWCV